jgi:hypothetical protein
LRKKRFNRLTIKTIPRFEFDRLLPHNPALESLMVEQVEWCSAGSGTMLGAIAKGEGVAGWNYVILERNKKGDFHIRKVMDNFFNLKAARVDLWLWMTVIEKSDRTNPETTNSWLPSVPVELPR